MFYHCCTKSKYKSLKYLKIKYLRLLSGAEGGTRTHTGLLPHAPETCASTNSTTSAFNYDRKSICKERFCRSFKDSEI